MWCILKFAQRLRVEKEILCQKTSQSENAVKTWPLPQRGWRVSTVKKLIKILIPAALRRCQKIFKNFYRVFSIYFLSSSRRGRGGALFHLGWVEDACSTFNLDCGNASPVLSCFSSEAGIRGRDGAETRPPAHHDPGPLKVLCDDILQDEKDQSLQDEWKTAGKIINRFCIGLYTFSLIVSTIGVFWLGGPTNTIDLKHH